MNQIDEIKIKEGDGTEHTIWAYVQRLYKIPRKEALRQIELGEKVFCDGKNFYM